nr:sensor histidine kinase [Chitinophagaceae bacterium]
QLYTTNRKQGEILANEVYTTASKHPETIKEFIDVHNLLGLFNQYNDKIEVAEKFFNNGLNLALKNKEQFLAEKIKTNIGNLFMFTGKYKECINYCLEFVKTLSDNIQAKANSLANIAICYSYLDNDNAAIVFQKDANSLFEKLNDKRGLSTGYNLLGASYKSLKQYDTANKYLIQSLQTKKQLKDSSGIISASLNLASIYFLQNHLSQTIAMLKEIEPAVVQFNSNLHSTSFYNNIANYYDRIEKFDSAIYYNKLSLKTVAKTKNLYLQANTTLNISKAYHKLNNVDSALKYRILANAYNDSLVNIEKNKAVAELSTKYETEKKELRINLLAKEDSIKAFKIYQQDVLLNKQLLLLANQQLNIANANLQMASDSLQLSKQKETIVNATLRSLKQEQEINLLAKEKQIKELELSKKNNTLIALAVLIALLILTGYFLYRHKKQQQEALLQQELYKQQQLAVVSILEAEEKERKRIAAELHDGVGQTMTAAWMNMQSALNDNSNEQNKKQIFENALKLLDESCKELRVVSHNMMPNVLLQKGLVNAVKDFLSQINKQGININIESDGLNKIIPAHVEAVLYRVIQESVNNVIKHANATQLFITLYNETDGIDVMIEDNGKGFNKKNIKSDGIGLQNIESRIKYLKGEIEWDTSEGNGTVISIHIPLTA